MSLTIDVGCGYRPTGDVNVDPNIEETEHRNEGSIDPRKIPNFVQACAEYLPFRSGVFTEGKTHHLLEHITDPLSALKELERVSHKAHITIPSNFSHSDSFHYYSWNLVTFTRFLSLVYNNVKVTHLGIRPYFGSRKLAVFNPVMGWLGFHKELEAYCS